VHDLSPERQLEAADRLGLLLPDLSALSPLRADPPRAAVLSDFDGTLSPIVERPSDARLLPGVADALAALRDRMGLVGLVSGRSLADLERIVDVPGLAYAGNHGMELHLPGEAARVASQAAEYLPAVAAFASGWPPERLAPHGVWLEEKGPTLSFHYRTAPDPAAAGRFLEAEMAPAARTAGLRVTGGRFIFEVRAPVRIDKGTAVRTLLDGRDIRAAVFLGDDLTDLDGWRALRELRDEGALDVALGLAVVDREVPAAVRDGADLRIEGGPAGALEVLRVLAEPL
jgi:trehalose 6-phosphate phosphatase